MGIYYLDGEYVDESEAMICVKDLAILRGYGVFDFLRTYNKRAFHLEEHVKRFRNSATLIGLTFKETDAEIEEIVQTTLNKNPQIKEANIRFLYTGGVSSDGVSPEGNGKLIVMVSAKHELPAWWYEKGVKLITVNEQRYIPGSKSINYLGAVIAQQQAKAVGAIEAVYVDCNNRILEGTTTNIFFLKGNEVHTPSNTILPGITRSVVMNLISQDYKLIERDIDADELKDFDEMIITASNKEVVPVIKVNDQVMGEGKVGAFAKNIMEKFSCYTDKYGLNQI